MQTFAKAAKAYAAEKGIKADQTAAATSTTVKFEGLTLGYYLVDSTLGTLCSLDTTNTDVVIKEKNAEPANTKTVEEDSTPGTYGEKNDADIGQTVNFKSTITAQAGAENYVFHDKMSVGLTFGSVTGITLNGNTVDAENYTVITDKAAITDDCTFEVKFTQKFCDTLKKEDKIVISYTATLNENAVIGGDGNPNESKISYGDSNNIKTTPGSTTTTYTWSFGVFKYTVSNNSQKALAGAKFTLSKNSDGSNPINLISKGGNVYRVAKAGEENTITVITTDATGKFTIEGLDSDIYYLTETEAPAGYNKLAAPIEVKVENGTIAANKTVNVENKTGTELPSTGGIGTTIFYVLGGILAVGAAVLLATKKRMDKSEG